MAREDTQFPKKREKTGGRAKGTPNKAAVEGREFAEQLVTDPGLPESEGENRANLLN